MSKLCALYIIFLTIPLSFQEAHAQNGVPSPNFGTIIVIDDPKTGAALQQANQIMNNFMGICAQKMMAALGNVGSSAFNQQLAQDLNNQCMCDHLSEWRSVVQIIFNASHDLLQRRPDLANRMVSIRGQGGTLDLSLEKLNANPEVELKKLGCKSSH